MSKTKFPKSVLAMYANGDDDFLVTAETLEDISEEHADQPVAIYELVSVGKFRCEKSVEAKPAKTIRGRLADLENMSHEDMVGLVGDLRLKLYTKNMSTKNLRRHLREYLSDRER